MEQTRVYRILVIEDEDSIRELVKLNLELADFEVIEAADGLEGLNKVIQEKPDLVPVSYTHLDVYKRQIL